MRFSLYDLLVAIGLLSIAVALVAWVGRGGLLGSQTALLFGALAGPPIVCATVGGAAGALRGKPREGILIGGAVGLFIALYVLVRGWTTGLFSL